MWLLHGSLSVTSLTVSHEGCGDCRYLQGEGLCPAQDLPSVRYPCAAPVYCAMAYQFSQCRMYNAVTREMEAELVPCCRKFGIRIVVYNPLACVLGLSPRIPVVDASWGIRAAVASSQARWLLPTPRLSLLAPQSMEIPISPGQIGRHCRDRLTRVEDLLDPGGQTSWQYWEDC